MIAIDVERVSPFVGAVAVALLVSAACNVCSSDELRRVPSPDAKFDAVVFLRGCDATTGFSTHVSLVDAGREVSDADSLLVADCPECNWSRERPHVEATWTDSDHLTIRTDRRARIFRASSGDRGVQVILVPVEAPAITATKPRQ
jgi:hypothetical protein